MGAMGPGFILFVHYVAVLAGAGIGGKVAEALAVTKGEGAEAENKPGCRGGGNEGPSASLAWGMRPRRCRISRQTLPPWLITEFPHCRCYDATEAV